MATLKRLAHDKCFRDDTNTSDCVDREAVLLAVCTNCEKFCSEQKCRKYTQIANLPSVTPKPTECEEAVSREAVIEITAETGALETQARVKALPPVTPKQRLCKDCKFFETDSWAKVGGRPLIVAHEICSRWGDGCNTRENGYCFLFEPKMEGMSE